MTLNVRLVALPFSLFVRSSHIVPGRLLTAGRMTTDLLPTRLEGPRRARPRRASGLTRDRPDRPSASARSRRGLWSAHACGRLVLSYIESSVVVHVARSAKKPTRQGAGTRGGGSSPDRRRTGAAPDAGTLRTWDVRWVRRRCLTVQYWGTDSMATFKDIRRIGDGGFGEVWLCCDGADSDTLYAKKKLLPTVGEDGVKRFVREVRILAKLDHPNVVKVLGFRLQEPPYWYVMPHYRVSMGDELPQLMGKPERIHRVFSAILDGVEYAHGEGVIHRDLKPDNVLMNTDEDLVVTDFGLGRMIDAESTRRTMTGLGMGTLLYMAPEQVRNAKDADHRSDIFSLGRMLYELFTEPLSSAIQDTSAIEPGVALIIDRCTQKLPERRFQTVCGRWATHPKAC